MYFAMYYQGHRRGKRIADPDQDIRLRIASIAIMVVVFFVVVRLFTLMVLQHGFYTALAIGSHQIYSQLFPARGDVYVQDSRTEETFPLAIDKDVFLMYADTRAIDSDDVANDVANKLGDYFSYTDEEKLALYLKLNKRTDPYEPLEKKLEESVVDELKILDLKGIHFIRRPHRYYPEGVLGAHTVGFVGKDAEGNEIGRYGIEGFWNQELAGSGGFLEGAKSARGGWIPLAGRSFKSAEDGIDIVLTIDRTIQFKACEILRASAEEYGASSAALVIMDPKTGAIRALCSLPDFDPNTYGKAESIESYNNTSIFTPYEIGSIFKPIAVAGLLNEGLATPTSPFYDPGVKNGVCDTPIRNADQKVYKDTNMTGILENSINTGMVYVVEQLGKKKFIEYVEAFGFGVKTGIGLDTENAGNIASLYINKGGKVDCYTATGSFGQGLTATPLQMVMAYSAIANGGSLMKPYVVDEKRYPNGNTEKTRSKKIKDVLEKRAASLLSGMLVRVVDSGHAAGAAVDGYYIAGKTGTAQIPGPGGYTNETNHSFVGFGPVDDPQFVMIVKFEKPRRRFSASTAAPTFGKVAKFILDYYQVPPGR